MSKKRILSIIMLVVLAAGIALAVYGATGTAIYNGAASMLGGDKKAAIGYIQNPESLKELSSVEKLGADKVKSFLKGLGADAAAVDAAVEERANYEKAVANSKDRDKFLAYAQSVDETVNADNLNDLIKDHDRSDPMRAANPKTARFTGFLLNYALFIILGLILVVVSIIRIDFLSMSNILNILQNASTKGILALGCAGLIVLAGTDLSIGRVLGISAAVTASLVQSTTYASRMYPTMVQPLGALGLLVPLFASIAVAVAFSLINGFGVAKLHLHAFIVTLGTQLIAYGANCLYIESQPSGTAQALSTFDPTFLNIAAGAIYIGELRIPLVVIYFLVLAAIVWVIWNKTKLGKNMFAVGGNTEAAAVSGVNVAKTIMLVYLLAGVLYGIASFLEAARITSVGANTGLNYELDAISAVVVGGVSFSGGVGTIQGVVVGAVIMQAIVYALQFLGINPYIQYIIRGLIIILAVSIDVRKYIVKK